jgi:hypothetical protein
MKPLFNRLFSEEVGDAGGGGGGGGLLSGVIAAQAPAIADPQAPAAPLAAPQPILGEDGRFTAGWYKGNPDLEPLAKQLDKFSDPAGLAKSYAYLERNRAVPAEGADAAMIDAFRKANNIPSTHEEYDLKFPESLPDGIQIDEAASAKYKELFHKLNLTPYQVEKLTEGHLNVAAEMFKGISAQDSDSLMNAVAELRSEWGIKFDANLATANATFDTLCTRAGVNPEQIGFTNDPKFARLMATVSTLLGESPVAGINATAASMRSGKSEAHEIMTNKNHPDYEAFYKPSDPRHYEVQERVARLNK